MIRFTPLALLDISGIDNATTAIWGAPQAERYLAFIQHVIEELEREPTKGSVIEQRPDLRIFTAKFSRRKSAKGHRIIYQQTDEGILVIRVLHTSMNWPSFLS